VSVLCLISVHDALDPAVELSHSGVETELVPSGTAHTSGHDTGLFPGAVGGLTDQWTARVALAGIDTAGSTASTDDLVVDAVHVVVAQTVADHREGDVTEGGHNMGVLPGVSPATGHTSLAVKRLCRARQADLPGVGLAQVHGGRQFQHGDVVAVRVTVLGVDQDSADMVHLRVGVVLDAGAAGQDGDGSGGGGVFHTVSCGHDPVLCNQGTATDVVAIFSQGNLPGVSLNGGGGTSDNLQTWLDSRHTAGAGRDRGLSGVGVSTSALMGSSLWVAAFLKESAATVAPHPSPWTLELCGVDAETVSVVRALGQTGGSFTWLGADGERQTEGCDEGQHLDTSCRLTERSTGGLFIFVN